MKVISWNVAGFRRAKTLATFDYSEIDYDYFSNKIASFNPDVICLQEVLIGEIDQMEVMAKKLGYEYWKSVKMSPDHTGKDDWIGLGIISKEVIDDTQIEVLPYPTFKLVFPDGREAQKFDKLILKAKIGDVAVATTQLQPLHYWGYNYYETPGYEYGREISKLIAGLINNETVLTGDFQFSRTSLVFKELYGDIQLKDSLPEVFTRKRENGKHTISDHIFIPSAGVVVDSRVEETMTDHFLCFVDFSQNVSRLEEMKKLVKG